MRYNHELNSNLRKACGNPASVAENNRLYPLVAAGDAAAREQMIVNNMPLVMSVVESFVSAHADYAYLQDDLVAEGFLGLAESINSLAAPGKAVSDPTSYLSRSVRYHIYRGAKPSPNASADDDTNTVLLNTATTPTDCIDMRNMIDSCCESSLDREIVAMREAGHTFAEIAKVTNMSKMTVVRMSHAIRDRFNAKVEELQQ